MDVQKYEIYFSCSTRYITRFQKVCLCYRNIHISLQNRAVHSNTRHDIGHMRDYQIY